MRFLNQADVRSVGVISENSLLKCERGTPLFMLELWRYHAQVNLV